MRKDFTASPLTQEERATHHTRDAPQRIDEPIEPLRGAALSTHAISAMQRNVGNAAVARLLDGRRTQRSPAPTVGEPDGSVVTQSEVHRLQLEAKIPIGRPSPPTSALPVLPEEDADEELGREKQDEAQEIEAILSSSAGSTSFPPVVEQPAPDGDPQAEGSAAGSARTAPAAGSRTEQQGPIRLPDIRVLDFENVDSCDAVSPWLAYSGTISQGGAPPEGFGVTRAGPMTVQNITATRIPVAGWWLVTATIAQRITWQVRESVGPRGQVNIPSAVSAGITRRNWPTVASDLTPDMSKLNGKPPRHEFWAKDLTERHELFHANDRKTRAPAALNAASAWLGTQQANSVADVNVLLARVPGRMVAAVTAGMAMPGKEERAYGDGADAYSRRARRITALGNVGYYRQPA